jgi:lysophospholipase L1-like esterase
MINSCRLLIAVFLFPALVQASDPFYFENGDRVVFLGDSISQGGTYISFIDAHILQQYPAKHIEFINLGLSSETASGNSEPDHPFPRPCIHTRIDRALSESKPDWVVICYGMNDGIYYPFGEDRFSDYVEGMRSLIAKAEAVGAKVIVMTPPPFDARSRKGPLAPLGQEKYSYKAPYESYNDVLGQYAGWVMSLDGSVARVINIYTPMQKYYDEQHAADPAYSSGDGIHPRADGHWIMAETFLNRVKAPNVEQPQYVGDSESSRLYSLVRARRQKLDAAWRNHVGHARSKPSPEGDFEKALELGRQQDREIRALLTESQD